MQHTNATLTLACVLSPHWHAIRRGTRIVPAWACIATTSLPMHEAFMALFGLALSCLMPRYINNRHHIPSFIHQFVVDPTRC